MDTSFAPILQRKVTAHAFTYYSTDAASEKPYYAGEGAFKIKPVHSKQTEKEPQNIGNYSHTSRAFDLGFHHSDLLVHSILVSFNEASWVDDW